MVFQSYGFESTTYNPINMGHASVAAPMSIGGGGSACSKKRKAFEDLECFSAGGDYQVRPKLNLPRSAGLVFNGDAQFHPLPADVNQALIAQLGHNPFTGSTVATCSSSSVTPCSSSSSGFFSGAHQHKRSNESDYFSTVAPSQYPHVAPYPSTWPTSVYGILGPVPGRPSLSDSDSMDVDGGSNPNTSSTTNIHGPHCKSIPQLCVRYNDSTGSELWATCSDCGTCSKVDSPRPSTSLCYSP